MSTDVTPERVLAEIPTRLRIGDGWREATGGRTFPVANPADGTDLASVADATAADGLAALDAAVAAQASWAATAPRERGEILRRAFEEIHARREELALLITLEMGKPLADAYAEIDYGAEFFRWFAEEAVRIDGGYTVSPNGRGRILVMRQPVGPSLLVTPWNFPLAMATRKIGPALAAGCTVVVKPAEQTPLTTLALAAILEGCGVPAGVVNVVTTSDPAAVVGSLLKDSRLRKLSFTGSTEVGRLLLSQAAGGVLRTSMELGGNAPFLVFADADLDAAVEGALLAKLRNMGEACTAANRFYVQRPVAAEFADRLAKRMAELRVAPGLAEGSQIGPLIDEAGRQKVGTLVDDAVRKGARVLTGGAPLDGPGYFYPPTVLADVPGTADLLTQEIFGPVAPVLAFDTEQEAVALANATEYGLVAYLYTRDLGRALRTAEALETGMIGLNQGVVSNAAAPFGGVKQSGLGREGGRVGIDEYLETKYIAIAV
ncbi:NAD-dependent succinate-semialdehyde dehydrogenase [Streptosporangium sp. 'caverna']|uniref:NAD-dependent succinate-semialdehyde dehydrogenase n=1 Tax=Streptosporangium sp. 'caverna' TaxID=2202249 RepID=UPI000D7D6807|nr:NAD-dependent succinate-semialdehyde dehydrogenase [Streptosporangium sp. 'caverna']AWS43912.1 NAD-dependent succinate-semialdehyde dehydrogenase [Streptosporangium sp. 'caverna']